MACGRQHGACVVLSSTAVFPLAESATPQSLLPSPLRVSTSAKATAMRWPPLGYKNSDVTGSVSGIRLAPLHGGYSPPRSRLVALPCFALPKAATTYSVLLSGFSVHSLLRSGASAGP